MIRKLEAPDLPAVETMLATAPEYNLYMRGNLLAQGLESDFCEFFGDFDAAGTLRALANRYFVNWVVYGRGDGDWPGIVALMEEHPAGAARVQDNPGGVESILPWLRRLRVKRAEVETLERLTAADFVPRPAPPGITVRRAGKQDRYALVELYEEAGAMRRTMATIERPLADGRIFVATDASGALLSAALTNAETPGEAMIGGVWTPEPERGRGLAQAVCSALCADLLADGKTPVLYWITPAAGTVYHKLGFKPVGTWRSVWLEPA